MTLKESSGRGDLQRRRAPSQPPQGPARFTSSGRQTSADLIYERLFDGIASMALVPGTPLSENELAAEHGVSRTPVREAILRLARDKFVEIVPKSGTFVARIPISALIEAMVVRRALEAVTVRGAVDRASPSQILEFRAMIQRQSEIAETGDLARFHRADEEFHAALAKAAGFEGIWDLIRQVKIQVDRYRQLTLPEEGRPAKVIAEHAAVIDAMEAGDADEAIRAMEEHLGKLQLDIDVFVEKWPGYFIHDRELAD